MVFGTVALAELAMSVPLRDRVSGISRQLPEEELYSGDRSNSVTIDEFFAVLKSFRNIKPANRIIEHDGTDRFPDGRHASKGVTVKKGTQLLQIEGFATMRLPLSSTSMVTIPTYNRHQREIVPPEVAQAIGNDVACCLYGDVYLRKYGLDPVLRNRVRSTPAIARTPKQQMRIAKPANVVFVACPACDRSMEGKAVGQHIQREHAEVAWRLYAQIYLERMWFGQGELDKRLVDNFKNEVTCEMLKDLFSPEKYNVARTIPDKRQEGQERYRPFVERLNCYRHTVIAREEVPGLIEQEVANMRKVYGIGPLSAITKAFWMMKQHPVVIYASEPLKGLKRRRLAPGDNYRTYSNSWFKFFDDPETQTGLDDALAWLPDSAAANKILERAGEEKGDAVAAEIRTLAGSQLMRNRVVDIRLFYEGGGFLEDPLPCNFSG